MYTAPVDDIAFTLKHVAGLGDALQSGALGDLDEDLVDINGDRLFGCSERLGDARSVPGGTEDEFAVEKQVLKVADASDDVASSNPFLCPTRGDFEGLDEPIRW